MKVSKYFIKARLFPAILCAVPILLLYYYGFRDSIGGLVVFLKGYGWTKDITISVAIVYLLTETNRFISKEFFQNIFFKEEEYMPSTTLLLHSNTYFSEGRKKRIHEKIKNDFGIEIYSKSREADNKLEARKTVIEAVAQIRNVTRNNSLLLQHNIEYGFTRNFIGGCTISFITCLFNSYFFLIVDPNEIAIKITVVLVLFYLLPITLSKILVSRYGKYYAKVLFEQFLKN